MLIQHSNFFNGTSEYRIYNSLNFTNIKIYHIITLYQKGVTIASLCLSLQTDNEEEMNMVEKNINNTLKSIAEEDLSSFRNDYESSPFWQLLGIEMDDLNPEMVRIKLSMSPSFLNVNRSVHGGIAASMLDSIMGVTLRHQNYDAKVATISLTIQYIAPILEGTIVYATAKVVNAGRRIASLEAKLESETGKILATGIATFSIKRSEA